MIRLKKVFRRFAAAVLCMILAMTAVGCGGGKSESGGSGSEGKGSVSSAMPEVTSKDGVVKSDLISLGEDFNTEGLQILRYEDGIFYGFNYSYEGDGLNAYELVNFKEDGSDLKKTVFKPEDSEVTDVTCSAFKDGVYYVGLANTANSEALDYALDNELDAEGEIPMGFSEDAAVSYQICCLTADGKQKWLVDVKEPQDSMYFYIESIVPTDDGILVVSTEGVDKYSTKDGSFVESLCQIKPEDAAGLLYALPDGTVLMKDDTGSASKILKYDAGKKEFADSLTLPSSLIEANIFPGSNYDLYLSSQDGIYGVKLGSDKMDVVVNFVNSDLDVEGVTSLIELGDGRFEMQAYGSQVVLETYLMEPIAPEDVKDRKEITIGGYYISYDVRSEIIKFNKENSDFRIIIRDYSQYDMAEDEYNNPSGISTMNTDIISGDIPDILVLSDSMPVNNYISKGMLMDLTDYYEADKDIDKGDFLQNVVDAFKTDGKMYVVVPGFTVTGIAGKAKYIGDGKDLTLAKAREIAKGMGLDDTGVLGIMDRETVLSTAIEFSGDQFIDMESHTCSFNNEDFQELLEFANKYPAAIGDDAYMDYETQYLADKALLGVQYINTPFDYYYMTRRMYGDINMTVTGFPSKTNKGPSIAPCFELGISSSSPNADGCWDFVRRFLLSDYQGSLESCLPLSKASIDKQGQTVLESLKEQQEEYEEYMKGLDLEISEEDASGDAAEGFSGDDVIEATDDMEATEEVSEDYTNKPVPEKDFDGTHEEYEEYVKEFEADAEAAEAMTGEEVIAEPEELEIEESTDAYGLDSLPEFSEDDLKEMEKILENLTFSVNSEQEVLNIIMEEAGAYFAGQKTTAEVSDIIQSRIQVYLKENE